jgi:hypothetical protein
MHRANRGYGIATLSPCVQGWRGTHHDIIVNPRPRIIRVDLLVRIDILTPIQYLPGVAGAVDQIAIGSLSLLRRRKRIQWEAGRKTLEFEAINSSLAILHRVRTVEDAAPRVGNTLRHSETGEIRNCRCVGCRRAATKLCKVNTAVIRRRIAKWEVDVGSGVVRVRQAPRSTDRDDQAGAVRLHITHRVIDGIRIGVRRIEVIRAVDKRDIRVEFPIVALQDLHPVLELVKVGLDDFVIQLLFRIVVAGRVVKLVRCGVCQFSRNGVQP